MKTKPSERRLPKNIGASGKAYATNLSLRDDQLITEAKREIGKDISTSLIILRMLRRQERDNICLLYLVLRTLDDLVDEFKPEAAERLEAVEAWCSEGIVSSRETSILDVLERRISLPRKSMQDYCEGMRHDLEGRTIETEKDLDRYCYLTSGSMAIMIVTVLGTRGAEAHKKAVSMGIAMQRTNILRDIDMDHEAGRTYIARETIERFGSLEPGQREDLMRDQISRAEAFYDDGMSVVPMLTSGRRATAALIAFSREILRQIEREGYGRKADRVVVPRWRKLVVVARHGLGRSY